MDTVTHWLLSKPLWQQLIIGLFAAAVAYDINLFIYRIFFHPLSKFPGPTLAKVTPWYRFYHNYIRGGRLTEETEKLHKKYGPVVRISPNELAFSTLEAYNAIYATRPHLNKDINFYRVFASTNGIFGRIDQPSHKVRREKLNPWFSSRAIADKVEKTILPETVEVFLARIAEFAKSKDDSLHLDRLYKCFTIDVISSYTFGKSYDSLKLEDYNPMEVQAILSSLQQMHFTEFFHFITVILFKLPLWASELLGGKVGQMIAIITRCFVNIQEFKAIPEKEQFDGPLKTLLTPSEGYPQPDPDFFLAELTFELIGAGMEETANAMFWATFYISKNPDAEAKLLEELKQAIPDDSAIVTKGIESLPYLHAIWKESLRTSYGVPGRLPRIAPPGGVTIDGVSVPGGTVVSSNSTVIHNNEDVFPNPDVFDPSRWLGPQAKSLERHLVAFGRGPRQCIGMNLAESEFKILMANLLRRYRFEVEVKGCEDGKLRSRDFLTSMPIGEAKASVYRR